MPVIKLETRIQAPTEVCFDLCRSIDLHKISTSHTREEAVGGVVSGLIDMDESVTWRAKHFGIYQHLTSVITEYDRPTLFVDELAKGPFSHFRHEHKLSAQGNGTLMVDIFDYTSPLGIVGRVVDYLVLEKYMRKLLEKRNQVIREFAENGRWKEVVNIKKKTLKS